MQAKMSSRYPDVDGNWQWPEKTWFRERLNALKAQENEQRRKAGALSKAPSHSAAPDASDKEPLKAE
jgi:hypothetical protein